MIKKEHRNMMHLIIIVLFIILASVFLLKSHYTRTVNNMEDDRDKDNLHRAISQAILEKNAGKYKEGDFATDAYTILKTQHKGKKTIVYASVLYLEFEFEGNSFSDISGGYTRAAISFKKNWKGDYVLLDYWTPRDGSNYEKELKGKFPPDAYENAMNSDKYILNEMQTCYRNAIIHGKIDVENNIEKFLGDIASSPTKSSRPYDYINAHQNKYRKVLYYGDYSLKYIYSQFLDGSQSLICEDIMLAIMRELLGEEDRDISAETAREWFDKWKLDTLELKERYSMELMEAFFPKSSILLKML